MGLIQSQTRCSSGTLVSSLPKNVENQEKNNLKKNEKDIRNVINEIKNAENPEMWKGAGWNIIKLYFSDSIVSLKTDNYKIGLRNSGEF